MEKKHEDAIEYGKASSDLGQDKLRMHLSVSDI